MKRAYYCFFASLIGISFICEGTKILKSQNQNGKPLMFVDSTVNQNNETQQNTETKTFNPWNNFMDKYNIPKNHEAGIYVDLALDVTLNSQSYRMPGGKCPVFGKEITISNSNKLFTDPVASTGESIRSGGLAVKDTTGQMSPMSINSIKQVFKDYAPYSNLDDITLCAKHANNFKFATDESSAYRHPAVYDMTNQMCHLLYVPIQENVGPRYCSDTDTRFLYCFKPSKAERSRNLVYLTKNTLDDWAQKCPRKNIENAEFGLWVDGNCEEMHVVKSADAQSLEECNRLLFLSSASDQPQMYEREESDKDKMIRTVTQADPKKLFEVLFAPGSIRTDVRKSKGVGLNWANFNKITKKCEMYNTVPTCLIDNQDYIATTALSHPTETENAFPCDIYESILNERASRFHNNASQVELSTSSTVGSTTSSTTNLNSTNNGNAIRLFISRNPKLLNCPCEPQPLTKSQCKFYVCQCVEKTQAKTVDNEVIPVDQIDKSYKEQTGLIKKRSDEGGANGRGQKNAGDKNSKNANKSGTKKVLIFCLIVLLILLVLSIPIIYYLKKKKKPATPYEKIEQAETFGKEHQREDELLDAEASFWGERRVTHTTPVYREKPYY